MSNLPSILSSCGCCSCGPVKYRYRTREATITKCGFAEYGTPSSPPKIYRTQIYSGTFTEQSTLTTSSFSGTEEYSRLDCNYTDSVSVAVHNPLNGCSDTVTQWASSIEPTSGYPWSVYYCIDINSCPPTNYTAVRCISPSFKSNTSSTQQNWTLSGGDPCYGNWRGTVTVTLSNEYTTQQLKDDCDTLCAAAPWSSWSNWGDFTNPLPTAADAFTDLSADETTATEREVQIEIAAPVPGNGSCLISYDKVYTVGVFLSDEESQQWDRTIPGGYDAADPYTWPVLTTFNLVRPYILGWTETKRIIPTRVVCDSGCT